MSRHDIENLAQFDALLAEGKTVVVDFTATWCGPCKRIAPEFEKLAAKFASAVFLKIDVDAQADVAQAQNVDAMPTFKIFKAGKVVAEVVGADLAGLTKAIEQHCA